MEGKPKRLGYRATVLTKHRGMAFIPAGKYLLCLIKNREGGVMGREDKKRKDYIK